MVLRALMNVADPSKFRQFVAVIYLTGYVGINDGEET
ncbi:MAG: hypothetical protein ACJAVI_001647 [Candidatus Azotimanducaceae bacterium]|jgi:hypothetical protein